MDFADRLRQRRKFLKLTQTQLAEKVGLKQQMIQQLETRKVLTTGKLVALAGALGVRPAWLATGEGPMQGDDLAADERQLIEGYRSLSPIEKAAALTLIVRSQTPATTGRISIHTQGHAVPMQQQQQQQR